MLAAIDAGVLHQMDSGLLVLRSEKTLAIGGCDLGRDLEQEFSPLTAFRHSSICSKTLPVHVDTMDM